MSTVTALARGNVYRLLSQAYLYPSEEFFALLRSGAFAHELDRAIKALLAVKNDRDLKRCTDSMIAALSKAAPGSLSDLRSEYHYVFGHTIPKDCPPYETQCGMADVFQQTQGLSDISGFYRAFGLEAKSLERLDHISVELEFIHFLCCKQAYALESNHGKEKVEICVEAQKKFLQQHLGKWVFAFAKLLKKKKNSEFYTTLAELTKSFISFELAYLDVKPKELGSPELTPVPSICEESCFSCGNESRA